MRDTQLRFAPRVRFRRNDVLVVCHDMPAFAGVPGPTTVLPLLGGFRLLLVFAAVVGLGSPATAEVVLKVGDSPAALESNLRSQLRLFGEDCESPLWRVRRHYARVEEQADPVLRALGYYRAEITKRFTRTEGCWRAEIDVQPGQRTTIRERRIEMLGAAADDPEWELLLEDLPLDEGDPLNHGRYEAVKSRIQSFATRRGYLDFAFTRQRLLVFPDVAAAEIDLAADSGQRYRFGEVRFGEQPLSDDMLRRLARFDPDQAFDSATLIEMDRQLSNSGYFRSVNVTPNRAEAEDGVVPVDVVLEAAPQHSWRAGVGFSTDTQWRVSLGYENRYLNEDGHRFESELRAGPVESGLRADYLLPGPDPHTENYSFGVRLAREDTTTAVSDSASLIARHVVVSDNWTQTRFIELLHERSEVGTDESRDTLLMPGIAFDRGFTDDLLRPDRGYRLAFELRGAHDALLSTTSLLQLRASARGVLRLGKAGRVLARTSVGTTSFAEIEDLPASLRFFAGGDNSVRGYAYKSLGPLDADGEVEGGRHLLTGSIEYEHPVMGDDWWLAGFVDAGNAFNSDEFDVKVGYGGGIRWYSPIGRIRLDIAFPDDREDDDWRIHFGLGSDL
jgi:translocation and assembly module TamA